MPSLEGQCGADFLRAAELIDKVNLEDIAGAITDAWIEEVDEQQFKVLGRCGCPDRSRYLQGGFPTRIEEEDLIPIEAITQELVGAGYLDAANLEKAEYVLAASLTDESALAEITAARIDEARQKEIIAGGKEYAEEDAAAGNRKDLEVDRAIIQDSINQEEVDEGKLQRAEKKVKAECEAAANSLAHAGLIDRAKEKDTASLIERTWTEGAS